MFEIRSYEIYQHFHKHMLISFTLCTEYLHLPRKPLIVACFQELGHFQRACKQIARDYVTFPHADPRRDEGSERHAITG